jgi:pyruvate kinase
MLSDETSKGMYPVLAVETMSRIVMTTEKNIHFEEYVEKFERTSNDIEDAISEAAATSAKNVSAEAIVALSEKGVTPRMIARYKPSQPIFVLTPNKITFRKIILSYGCVPEIIEPVHMLSEAVSISKKILVRKKFLKTGDRFVLAAGIPFGQSGGTNMISVQVI